MKTQNSTQKQNLFQCEIGSKLLFFCFIVLVSSSTINAQIAWPLNPTNQIHRIFCAYGNYDDGIDGTGQTTGKSLHFHEGLDILPTPGVAQNTNVIASENGTVRLVNSIPQNALNGNADGYLSHILVTRGNSTTEALVYMHCTPGINGRTRRIWQNGDAVVAGDVLGTIAERVGLRPHLHFGWQSKKTTENWFVDPKQGVVEYAGNPIDILTPTAKNNRPVVFSSIFLTSAGIELTTKLHDNKTVINGNVDMINRSYDRFGPANTDEYDISVKKLEWSAQIINQCDCASVPTQTPINFTGKFLAAQTPNKGRNFFSKFHSVPLLHTIYSTRPFARSLARNVSATYTNAGRYFMYLTNIDQKNDSLETTDAPFYWNTKAKATSIWNAQQAANTADSNKNALTPDGRYQIAVTATGYGGATDVTTKYDTVMINNFNEFIYSCNNTGVLKDTFCTGDPVYIRGKGFPKFFTFSVSVVKHRTWPNGTRIPNNNTRVAVAEVSSDENGGIPPTLVWNAYQPNGTTDAGYEIVLDYDGDSTYSTPKSGFIVDPIDQSIGGTVGIIGSNLKATSTRKNVSCNGKCDGKITINATGGKPPYTYYYDYCCPGPKVRDSLCAGVYVTSVIDAMGCRVDVFDTITEPAALKLHNTSTNVSCNGNCDGTITLSASGGTAPYTYSWPGGTLSNLCAGTYTGTVTDSNGCSDTVSVTIYDTSSTLNVSVSVTNASCNVCNGTATMTASGGSAPYTYSWPNGTLSNLCAGTYTGTVTDANGCTDTVSVIVYNTNSTLSVSGSGTNADCNQCNGTATMTASGGTAPYTYSWPNGTLSNLCAGTYTGTVTDANGCTATYNYTVIQQGQFGRTNCDTVIVDTTIIIVDTIDPRDSVIIAGNKNANGNRVNAESQKTNSNVTAYPNPFKDAFTVAFFSKENAEVTVQLFDAVGRTQINQKTKVLKGMNYIPVNAKALNRGAVYLLKIDIGNIVFTRKMIKQ